MLQRTAQEPVIQANAACALEGWADWLGSNGRANESDAFRRQSHGCDRN